jgi:hypothetical protein
MTRTFISLLALLPIAVALAWNLGIGEQRGVGVLAGYVVGAGVSWWCIYLQRHVIKNYPDRIMSVTVIDLSLKLFVVLVGAIGIRYVPQIAAVCDWRAFLLTFATISLVVLTFGTLDAVRSLASSKSSAEEPAQS